VLELPGNIEKETYLETAESYEIDYDGEDNEDDYLEEPESSQSSQEWEYFEIDKETFDLDYMKRVVACYEKEGWKATRHNFRRIKQRNYIYRFRDYIEQQGTKSDKLLAINP